jgi:hypothetical protein
MSEVMTYAMVIGFGLIWAGAVYFVSGRLLVGDVGKDQTRSTMQLGLPLIGVALPATFVEMLPTSIAAPLSVFVLSGLAIAYWDLVSLRVPRLFCLVLGALAIAYCAAQFPERLLIVFLGGAGASSLLYAARHHYAAKRGKSGLGGADPVVFGALVMWLGPYAGLWTLALGSLLAFGWTQLLSGKAAFASALVLASWIVICARTWRGQDIFFNPGWGL